MLTIASYGGLDAEEIRLHYGRRVHRSRIRCNPLAVVPEASGLTSEQMLNVNDKQASDRVAEILRRHFPLDRVRHTGPAPASEDFGCFGSEWNAPSVYWFVGGTDPDIYAKAKAGGRINDLPVNHSPLFAPVIHPTLQTGIEAMVAGVLAWLAK